MELTQNQLFEENIKLVPYAYSKLIRKSLTIKNNKEDIMQEGYLGLLYACKNFDENKGNFSTYATKYIVGTMKKFIYKLYKADAELCLQDTVFDDNNETTFECMIPDCLSDDFGIANLTVKKVIDESSVMAQKIIYLSMIYEKQEEVAKKLNITQAYVSKTLNKLKDKMKELLELCD